MEGCRHFLRGEARRKRGSDKIETEISSDNSDRVNYIINMKQYSHVNGEMGKKWNERLSVFLFCCSGVSCE